MTPKELAEENAIIRSEMSAMMAENILLTEKVSGVCKVYTVVRPVLKVLRIFAFIKAGGKAAIDAAIAVLDGVCKVNE